MDHLDGIDLKSRHLISTDAGNIRGVSHKHSDVPPEVALFPPVRPSDHINILEGGPRPPRDQINIFEGRPCPPRDRIKILEGGTRDPRITRMASTPPKQRLPLHQLNEHPSRSNEAILKSQTLLMDCGETTAPRTVSTSTGRGKKRPTNSSMIGRTQKKPMRGQLKPKHNQVIIQNYEYLKIEIDARHITGHMVSSFIISLEDKEEINSKTTQSSRTECFLDRLLQSGPGQAFDTFLDALKRKNYAPAHRKLRQDLQKL